MTAESPTITVDRFSRTWTTQSPKSLLAEFKTIAKETNREPDSYYFLVDGGKLIDPNTNEPILKFIAEGIEKNVARDLEKWAEKNDEGMALWVSPAKAGEYPCPKIILHQITYKEDGQKVVLNSAILFDGKIINPNHKRQTLYTFADTNENALKVLNFIKRKSGRQYSLETDQTEIDTKAVYFLNQIQIGIPLREVIQKMVLSGFVGNNPISCPGGSQTYSSFVTENSFLNVVQHGKWEYHTGSCRLCEKEGVQVGPCKICKTCERKFDKVSE